MCTRVEQTGVGFEDGRMSYKGPTSAVRLSRSPSRGNVAKWQRPCENASAATDSTPLPPAGWFLALFLKVILSAFFTTLGSDPAGATASPRICCAGTKIAYVILIDFTLFWGIYA